MPVHQPTGGTGLRTQRSRHNPHAKMFLGRRCLQADCVHPMTRSPKGSRHNTRPHTVRGGIMALTSKDDGQEAGARTTRAPTRHYSMEWGMLKKMRETDNAPSTNNDPSQPPTRARRARSAAASSITPSWSQTVLALILMALSTTAPASSRASKNVHLHRPGPESRGWAGSPNTTVSRGFTGTTTSPAVAYRQPPVRRPRVRRQTHHGDPAAIHEEAHEHVAFDGVSPVMGAPQTSSNHCARPQLNFRICTGSDSSYRSPGDSLPPG